MIRVRGAAIVSTKPAGALYQEVNTSDTPVAAVPTVAEVVLIPTVRPVTIVVPAGIVCTSPSTSQSPAARLMLAAFAVTDDVTEVEAVVAVTYSPTEPAFALSFVAVPAIPAVLDGVIVLEAVIAEAASVPVTVGPASVGLVPNTKAPEPVSFEITPASWALVVAANCASVPPVSANVAPHDHPVPLVYCNALFAALQLGITNAVGDALEPVTFATTVFAACAARFDSATEPEGRVTVPDAVRLVNEPVDATLEPIGPGAAKVCPPNVDALTLLLHMKPAPYA